MTSLANQADDLDQHYRPHPARREERDADGWVSMPTGRLSTYSGHSIPLEDSNSHWDNFSGSHPARISKGERME